MRPFVQQKLNGKIWLMMQFFRAFDLWWYIDKYGRLLGRNHMIEESAKIYYCWRSISGFFLVVFFFLLSAIIHGNILWVWWYAFAVCLCMQTANYPKIYERI